MHDLTLARKNLLNKRFRFVLMFVVISIAFILYGVLVSVQEVFEHSGGADDSSRMVVSNKVNFTQPLPISYFEKIKALDGIAHITHATWFGGFYREPRNFLVSFAVDPETYLDVYPEITLSANGRATFLHDRSSLIVGIKTAEKYGWKVGQQISLMSNIFSKKNGSRSWKFIIADIYTNSKKNGDSQSVFFHYHYFNETRSLDGDKIGSIAFTTKEGLAIDTIAASIDQMFANAGDETSTVSEQEFARAFLAQFGNIGLIVTVVVGVAFLTILLIVGNTMAVSVHERIRQIGILKTLGFPYHRIVGITASEPLILSVLGALAGLAIASEIITFLRESSGFGEIRMSFAVWATGLSCALGLASVTSVIPIRTALTVKIINALGRT
jgi:putative ABC transport system permease protein